MGLQYCHAINLWLLEALIQQMRSTLEATCIAVQVVHYHKESAKSWGLGMWQKEAAIGQADWLTKEHPTLCQTQYGQLLPSLASMSWQPLLSHPSSPGVYHHIFRPPPSQRTGVQWRAHPNRGSTLSAAARRLAGASSQGGFPWLQSHPGHSTHPSDRY